MSDRDLDLVVFGATGFVGKLTADYLARHAPADVRIGLAGRSRAKLEEVRRTLGAAATGWPVLEVDAGDVAAVQRLASSATAVATTVGPYMRHGMPVVEACAKAGTHYADLTGEVLFMRDSIEQWDGTARATGARIVHACGFDSIPSDIGVLVLHEAVANDGAGDLEDTSFVVTGVRGGVSGGTLASMKSQLAELKSAPEKKRIVDDPYALSPARDKEPDLVNDGWPRETDLRSVVHDDDLHRWLAPFVMEAANTRVVRRSNALQDWVYGHRLRYREVMGFDDGPIGLAKASAITAGLAAFAGAMTLSPTRAVLDRVLPGPGEGPSQRVQTKGFFRIEIHTRTSTGARYVARVSANGDPGYAATAVMLGESALALAMDSDHLPPGAGVLTPATGIGVPLADRLRRAGFTMEVQRLG